MSLSLCIGQQVMHAEFPEKDRGINSEVLFCSFKVWNCEFGVVDSYIDLTLLSTSLKMFPARSDQTTLMNHETLEICWNQERRAPAKVPAGGDIKLWS